LLRAPVSSRNGLGIGLYQAARLAESSGYRLELESNRDGAVCFVLIQGSTPAATIRP
jgi:signal transduction histidine kinase